MGPEEYNTHQSTWKGVRDCYGVSITERIPSQGFSGATDAVEVECWCRLPDLSKKGRSCLSEAVQGLILVQDCWLRLFIKRANMSTNFGRNVRIWSERGDIVAAGVRFVNNLGIECQNGDIIALACGLSRDDWLLQTLSSEHTEKTALPQ